MIVCGTKGQHVNELFRFYDKLQHHGQIVKLAREVGDRPAAITNGLSMEPLGITSIRQFLYSVRHEPELVSWRL